VRFVLPRVSPFRSLGQQGDVAIERCRTAALGGTSRAVRARTAIIRGFPITQYDEKLAKEDAAFQKAALTGNADFQIDKPESDRPVQRRLPKVRFWNFYGQTEIAPLATVLKPEDQLRKAGSAGKPAINVATRVVNTAMEDVKVGEIGEIVHRSPHLLSGYYNDPAKTAAAFSGGWFHSGDLATVDADGYITVVDRVKDMIKTGGENVASREVEGTIYRIPAVSEVAVVGLPDPRWIEAVTAIIVVKAGERLDEDAVIRHCAGAMAPFKVPKGVIFVDSLPKNPSGKLLKRELRQRFAGGDTLDKAIHQNAAT
jgi:fatty-acyl-CoA synthase